MANVTANRKYWHLAWALIFAANLIVPLWLGLEFTRHGGRVGMTAGIITLWLLGHWACARSNAIGFMLVTGGGVIAATQLFAIPQVMSGMISIALVSKLGLAETADFSPHGTMTEFGGFLATIMTGTMLIMGAIAFGALAYWAFNRNDVAYRAVDPVPDQPDVAR